MSSVRSTGKPMEPKSVWQSIAGTTVVPATLSAATILVKCLTPLPSVRLKLASSSSSTRITCAILVTISGKASPKSCTTTGVSLVKKPAGPLRISWP